MEYCRRPTIFKHLRQFPKLNWECSVVTTLSLGGPKTTCIRFCEHHKLSSTDHPHVFTGKYENLRNWHWKLLDFVPAVLVLEEQPSAPMSTDKPVSNSWSLENNGDGGCIGPFKGLFQAFTITRSSSGLVSGSGDYCSLREYLLEELGGHSPLQAPTWETSETRIGTEYWKWNWDWRVGNSSTRSTHDDRRAPAIIKNVHIVLPLCALSSKVLNETNKLDLIPIRY